MSQAVDSPEWHCQTPAPNHRYILDYSEARQFAIDPDGVSEIPAAQNACLEHN